MNREDIIRMAREAFACNFCALPVPEDRIERFAALVAAHIRETEFKPDWNNYNQGRKDGAEDKRGVRTLKIFGMGDKKDAPKPLPKTATEVCKNYREKKKMMRILNALAKEIS